MQAIVDQLFFYPVKGCRGIPVDSARLAATGLEIDDIGDREWVVADADGRFLSQRELPKMTLIETRLTSTALRLRAPGMLELEVPFASEGDVIQVQVWNDRVAAVTQGEVADAWFSRYLGQPCRLMRFDPEARRLSSSRYTGAIEAPYKFADAFALLIASTASLADLNRKLAGRGAAAVGIERFRPNIVLAGVEAFEEDYIERLSIGDATLRVVKPCVRCSVPNVDPATGVAAHEPGDTLAVYRDNERAGGVTFGVNAIVAAGAGATIARGAAIDVTLAV
ncbi:MAG TPA: MOSC N-terminal beta barrel domain-containing protein [Burkholderiaceae bacterium]|nr:MOSC N-terminal beta barrel domain-containing protein [Burkholderiaceae bacterium]HQR70228.1 MOSC N-terminal beta barrel domain-containing protein [Burkholderiaceae bacterium]